MKHFWDCSETIPDGLGFEHFDEIHLIWLGAFAVFTLIFSFIYKGASPNARRYMAKRRRKPSKRQVRCEISLSEA